MRVGSNAKNRRGIDPLVRFQKPITLVCTIEGVGKLWGVMDPCKVLAPGSIPGGSTDGP